MFLKKIFSDRTEDDIEEKLQQLPDMSVDFLAVDVVDLMAAVVELQLLGEPT